MGINPTGHVVCKLQVPLAINFSDVAGAQVSRRVTSPRWRNEHPQWSTLIRLIHGWFSQRQWLDVVGNPGNEISKITATEWISWMMIDFFFATWKKTQICFTFFLRWYTFKLKHWKCMLPPVETWELYCPPAAAGPLPVPPRGEGKVPHGDTCWITLYTAEQIIKANCIWI